MAFTHLLVTWLTWYNSNSQGFLISHEILNSKPPTSILGLPLRNLHFNYFVCGNEGIKHIQGKITCSKSTRHPLIEKKKKKKKKKTINSTPEKYILDNFPNNFGLKLGARRALNTP